MGVIAKDDRKITLYYHSGTSLGKQTYGYIVSSKKKILAVDISKTKVKGTQWAEIASDLKVKIADLINKEHPDFIKKYGPDSLYMEQLYWLKLMEKSP
jgi:hypothetical protein